MGDYINSNEELPPGKSRCPICKEIHSVQSNRLPDRILSEAEQREKAPLVDFYKSIGMDMMVVFMRCPHCGTTYEVMQGKVQQDGPPPLPDPLQPPLHKSQEVMLRVLYSGGSFLVDANIHVLLDGKSIGTGSAVKGVDVSSEVTPGTHTLQVVLGGLRKKDYTLDLRLPGRYDARLTYSRMWGTFTKDLDLTFSASETLARRETPQALPPPIPVTAGAESSVAQGGTLRLVCPLCQEVYIVGKDACIASLGNVLAFMAGQGTAIIGDASGMAASSPDLVARIRPTWSKDQRERNLRDTQINVVRVRRMLKAGQQPQWECHACKNHLNPYPTDF